MQLDIFDNSSTMMDHNSYVHEKFGINTEHGSDFDMPGNHAIVHVWI